MQPHQDPMKRPPIPARRTTPPLTVRSRITPTGWTISNSKQSGTSKSKSISPEHWTTSTQTVPSATDPDGLNPTVVVGGAGPDSFRTALDEETWNSDTAVEYQSRVNSAIDSITAVLDALVAVVTSAENTQKRDPGEKVPPHSDEANWGQY